MNQRRVLRLAMPIIGENLLQTLIGVVDTVFVAALGASALAGVGVASEIVYFAIAILSAVSIGGTVIVAQAIGAKDSERANQLARQTVMWGIVIAIPISIVSYSLAPTIVSLFQTEPDVATEATTYLRVIGATFTAFLLTFVCGAVLRGAGDSQTPLRASIAANILNVILSYGLIFGELGFPRLEVAGSAWSTAIGRGTGAMILIAFLFSGRRAVSLAGRDGWLPKPEFAKSLMAIGLPTAVEQILTNAGITTLVAIIAMIGTDALAAQQIIFTSYAIALLPGMGFAIAATALVGQSVGARSSDDVLLAKSIALRWSLTWMGVAGLVYVSFSRQILGLVTNDASVVATGAGALVALGVALPMLGFQSVHGGALRGLGEARTPMIINATAVWVGVAMSWAAVVWFDGSLTWVWIAFILPSPIAAVLIRRAFQRRLAYTRETLAARPPISPLT